MKEKEKEKNRIEFGRIVTRNRPDFLFTGRKLNARLRIGALQLEEDAFAATTVGALTAPVVVLAPLVSPSNYCQQMRDRPLAQVCRRFDIASSHEMKIYVPPCS